MRTAKGYVQFPAVLIHGPAGNMFFIAPHVVVAGLVVAPRPSPSGVVANMDRSLAALYCEELLFSLDIFEYGVGF
jgi:hypothetical protein